MAPTADQPPKTGSERSSEPDDMLLIQRTREGDRSSFDRLIRRHERRVYNLAYRLCGNPDDAADVAADAFVRVYNSLASFRGDASFLTWIYRITTNIYLDARKRKRARPQVSLDELVEMDDSAITRQYEDHAPLPTEVAELNERARALQGAVSRLPDYQRVMVVMYHVEGKSYEEIAAAAGLPIGTVKSRLNRARLALRELLKDQMELF
ncbi:MAG: sigma-70 family RNA polymerase sigma factor [Armatimonadetes bacterium]|nr:sigma-70 family RNA polymerase sigma factor [Armatimonadota bacterium]